MSQKINSAEPKHLSSLRHTQYAATATSATQATWRAANSAPQSPHHNTTGTRIKCDEAFEVTPQEVVFHTFEPHKVYEASVSFKNKTKSNQYIRIARPDSHFFSLTAPKGSETTLKVASGLSVTYKVVFKPDDLVDYQCDLTVLTEDAQFMLPVRSYCSRGKLELPEEVVIDDCPVKGSSSTSVFLRNTQKDVCVWRAEVDPPFALTPLFGTVPGGGGVTPLEVMFNPDSMQPCHRAIRFFLGPEGDMVQEVPLRGSITELDVRLDQEEVVFDTTYVATERQAVVRVINNSDHILKFCWKADASDAEEARINDTAALQLEDTLANETGSSPGERMRSARVDVVRRMERVVDDDVFSIEPSSGVIYGKATKEFTVTFTPQLAIPSSSTVYLDISGRKKRLPLVLTGRGLGPQCRLEHTKLNIGDVYVNALHEYNVEIENLGSIEARYSVLPSESLLGQRFTFTPSEGVLAPGEMQNLQIQLRSDLIGVIAEKFHIHLHGSVEDLTLQFKGRVMGPTFEFNVDELDFGNVSYNFWHTRTFKLSNTSQVPMNFFLHLPDTCPHVDEFTILPASGVIAPKSTQHIQVDFLSNTPGEYETALLVDVLDVGEGVDSLPVKAACMVPPLNLSMEKLHYGHCFVGHDYTMHVEVLNDTAMSAKFEVALVSDDAALKEQASVIIGDPAAEAKITILGPHKKAQVPVTLRALEVGGITFSLCLRVLGSHEPPQTILVTAMACGPNIEVSPSTVSFGAIRVLQDMTQTITLKNTSPIAAHFTASLTKVDAYPVFTVEPSGGVIDAYGSIVLTMTACLDEAMGFLDTLCIDVVHSRDAVKPITVKATGTGFALVPDTDLGELDFGDVFTETEVERVVVLHNKGRKNQEIQWHNVRGTKAKEGAPPIVFYVKPERAIIPARKSVEFRVKGFSKEVGTLFDEFYMKHSGTFKEVMRSKIVGNFMAPLLTYSTKTVHFDYTQSSPEEELLITTHEAIKNDAINVPSISKSFTIKNISPKELEVILKIRDAAKSPFTLTEDGIFNLVSGETRVIGVAFNPTYKGDRLSHTAKSKLLVSFGNHPHKETITFAANVQFPSVVIEPTTSLNFGTIMKDTEQRRHLELRNPSEVTPAAFMWKIQKPDGSIVSLHEQEPGGERRFDFIPFKGVIPPGGSQQIEAAFYGANGTFESTAICAVAGGPCYPVTMTGSAGEVELHYDRTSLDFGVMPFHTSETKTISVTNPSNVETPFEVNLFSLKNRDAVQVTPLSGVFHDKLKLQITFSPIVPDEVREVFFIQIGHFDPQQVVITGKGVMNSLAVLGTDPTAPVQRLQNAQYLVAMEEVQRQKGVKPYLLRTNTTILELPSPPQYPDIESLEAERLAYCSLLCPKTSTANMDHQSQSGMEETELYPVRRTIRRNSATAKGPVKNVLSRYVIDFGNLTRLDSRSTKIKLVNTCSEPLALSFDTKELSAMPITINPPKIPKLTSLQSLTLELTIDASSADHQENILAGENKYEIAIDIRGGPLVVIECRCYIATPYLKISEPAISFGEVLKGQVKVLPLTLTNEQAVLCEWKLSCKESKQTQLTDVPTPQFWANIEQGVLAANETRQIEVYFAPFQSDACRAVMQFRFAHNPKTMEVKLDGVGRELNVTVSPMPLEFPVVRPFQVAHETFTVTNNEECPVEIFSYNLDTIHNGEAQILYRAVRAMPDHKLLLPVRAAGQPLPLDVIDSVYRTLESQSNELVCSYEDEIQTAETTRANSRAANNASKLSDRVAERREEEEPIAVNKGNPIPTVEEPIKPCLIVLVGPPASGKTTQSHRLQNMLGYSIVDWNSLILAEAEKDTANGEVLRNILTIMLQRAQMTNTKSFFSPNATSVTRPTTSSSKPFDITLPSILRTDDFDANKTTNSKRQTRSPVGGATATIVTTDQEFERYSAFIPTILRALLRARIEAGQRQSSGAGFIMDDLGCCITSNKRLLLTTIKEVCDSMEFPLHVVSLAVSEASVGLRESIANHAICEDRVSKAFIEPLPEEAYESLDSEKQDAYNRQLKYLNECRRELNHLDGRITHYQNVLSEKQPSIQDSLEEERALARAALMEGTTKGTRKGTKRAAEPEVKEPNWDTLDEMGAFKELCNFLCTSVNDPEAGWDKQMQQYHLLNGEQPSDHLADSILYTIRDPNPAEEPNEEAPLEHSTASVSVSIVSASNSFLIAGCELSHAHSRLGTWNYYDLSRLRALRKSGIEFVRFFGMVDRDYIQVKKNVKSRAPAVIRQHEEMTRWLLPPRSVAKIQVEFCCDQVGEQIIPCVFGAVGTHQLLDLSVKAKVCLPDIGRDDKTIFPVVRTRMPAGRPASKVFLSSKRVYDFGPLLIPNTGHRRRKSERTPPPPTHPTPPDPPLGAEETLTFTNEASSPADVMLYFAEEKERTFSVEPSKFTLAAGGTQTVVLKAAPDTVGESTNQLIASVKDNPTPWIVQVSCTGTKPDLTVDGKADTLQVNFGRAALNRSVEHTATLVNCSRLPILWTMHGLEKLPPEITMTETSGVIEENGAHPLSIVFEPTKTCLHTITLQMHVMDAAHPNSVYDTIPVVLKAEGHDTILEWTREVDFGTLHVGESKKEMIRVLNKGPYDVGYMIRLPKRLQGMLTITPQSGTIRGLLGFKDAAIANIELSAHFDREGEIPKKLGQLEVSFFNPEAHELLYPIQTIPISGEAWYTRYSVKPNSIDFGSCHFSQRKQATFEIRNTGRFPVYFNLFDYRTGCDHLRDAAVSSRQAVAAEQNGADVSAIGGNSISAASLASKKQVVKTGKGENDFKIGCFTVTPARGTVPVGDSLMLTVSTVPEPNSSTRETIGVFVEQSEPSVEAKGIPIQLSAHPATPGIAADLTSTSDIETIFEEQQVVFRLSQFDRKAKAYGKEDRAFSFGITQVGARVEERFRIANSSPLPCTVSVQILSISGNTAKAPSRPDCFDLGLDENDGPMSTLRLTLPPFESRFATIGFTPASLQRFEARFLATVENGTDPRTNNLTFNIAGEGTLPNVEYILPPRIYKKAAPVVSNQSEITSPVKQSKAKSFKDTKRPNAANAAANVAVTPVPDTVELPVTRVGSKTARTFTVRNTGDVPADVRLTMVSDEFLAKGLSVPNRNRDITIPVGSEQVFEVLYAPTEVGKATMTVRIALPDNPFENRDITVEGHSFDSPISFEGIDPASCDFVDIGDCYVGQPKQHTFQVRNNTASSVRFAWQMPKGLNVEMNPAAGHISPGSTKSVTVTLLSQDTSRQQRAVLCDLQAQSIEVFDASSQDWDTSMVNQKWVVIEDDGSAVHLDSGRRNLKKVLEPIPEPSYRLSDEVSISQQLRIGFMCDKPIYEVVMLNLDKKPMPLDAISFPTTKMFQRRIVTLRITNPGNTALPFEFRIEPKSEAALEPPPVTMFAAEPAQGHVPAGGVQMVNVVYSPQNAEESRALLVANFPYSERPRIQVPLHGVGECPLVHFQVPPSNYLEQRVDGEAGASLDPETVVVEFLTRGLHSRTTAQFKVINPTSMVYQFEWIDRSEPGSLSPFRCLTSSGTIAAGKHMDMTFEFSAATLGTREARWEFYIAGKASVPFLLVGKAVEPVVFFNSSKINFGSVTVGNRVEKVMVLENRDDIPFAFNIEKLDIAPSSFLTVKPMSGTIGPKEKLPITVNFTPQDEMEYNLPIVCNVKKASTPLSVNIKGEGYRIHDALQVEADEESEPLIPIKGQLLHVNLGRVQVDEVVTRRFVVSNMGQYPFEFLVNAPERRFITIDTLSGTVAPKQRCVVRMQYCPTLEEHLRQYRMQFRIGGKVAYQIGIQAASYIPKLHLSYEKLDFGPRFISGYSSTGLISSTLSLINNDKEMITVDCSLSENNNWCTLESTSFMVRPNSVAELKLSFDPQEVRMYDDKLKLLLNGVHSVLVPISGEGVVPRVEVLSHFAKMGVARVGERREVELKLECRSRIPTPVSFVGCLDDYLVQKGVSVSSGMQLVLKPREVRPVTLSFRPTHRMGEFQREMKMLVCGKEVPFAIVTGSCEDAEIHLDSTQLNFDDVVVGSSATRRLVVMNSGDISQKFVWNVKSMGGELTVNPPSAFIRSYTEYSCEFTYTPTRADSNIQKTAEVTFDNSPPLSITIQANSIERPPAKSCVQFRCRSRETDVQKVLVENPFNQPWTFEPEFDRTEWTGPSSVTMKPRGKAEVVITYAPMRTTQNRAPDFGTMFIPQPDGTGQTYTLEGVADPHGPSGPPIELNIEAKSPTTVNLNVQNWSTGPLRFTRDVQWTPEPEDGLISVKGTSGIEVLPNATKEYALTIACMREGMYRGVVSFTCSEKPEMMQFYEISLHITGQPHATVVDLYAQVRTSASHTIVIANPFAKTVNIACKLEGGADCLIVAPAIQVPAKGEANLPVEFFPLVHKEYSPAKLTLTSNELGVMSYILKLQSSAATSEPITRLMCALGQNITFSLRFTHYARSNTDFIVHIGSTEAASSGLGSAGVKEKDKDANKFPIFTKVGQGMSMKAQSSGWPKGQELAADFTYEPQSVGTLMDTIEFTSPVGGTYTFPIIATCSEPQRQGPYLMRPNQSTPVAFKNVFADHLILNISTDNAMFILSKRNETLAPKKSTSIAVQCKLEDGSDTARARLTVSCLPPGEKQPVEWVYYLECNRYDSGGSTAARRVTMRKK